MVLGVVATLRVKAGSEDDFQKTFGELQARVRASEPDCLQYDLFRSGADGQVFVVMEQYASQAALDAHMASAHFQEISPRLGPLLDGAPDLNFLGKVS